MVSHFFGQKMFFFTLLNSVFFLYLAIQNIHSLLPCEVTLTLLLALLLQPSTLLLWYSVGKRSNNSFVEPVCLLYFIV